MKTMTTAKKKPRQSNMELLRILAMFLILVVHADFWALGSPTTDECIQQPLSSATRIFIESVSILSVNTFVLISGWFSIKASVRGFCNFIFQCAFFLLGIYAVMLIAGLEQLSFMGIRYCLLLTTKNWFIKSYIGLYILAPVLNAFCEKATKQQMQYVLVAFFAFQTFYGIEFNSAPFINWGCSTFSFIGLYLLARYINIYKPVICKWGGVLFLVSIVFNTVAYYSLRYNGISLSLYAYSNPIVIMGALGLLLWFANLKMNTSRFINWVAASSFAVFLLHGNPNLGTPYYKPLMQHLYATYSGIPCLCIMGGTLVAIFVVAILLDQPRKWLWNRISKKLP